MKKAVVPILFFLTVALAATYHDAVPAQAFDEAQDSISSVSMPVEYVNYVVSTINGTLWATVDGTFPMQIPQAQVGQGLPMVYPAPPGVTNISLKLNGQPVDFSNLTQSTPEALHYTYLGYWPMILFIIQPASANFVLTIHYQHPIVWADERDMFLYDLNISPYLSNSSATSAAHFTVVFKAGCTNIKVYTVAGDRSIPRNDVRTPVNFTLSSNNGTQVASFTMTSDYAKPVLGDELVTFSTAQTQIPEVQSNSLVLSTLIAAVAVALLLLGQKQKSRREP